MTRKRQAAKLLRDAAALIEDPERWTTTYFARTAEDHECLPTDKAAAKWCMLGALGKISGKHHAVLTEAQTAVERHVGYGIGNFNDTHTHDEVLRAMRAAAESLEAQE